jgi:hypothetical protein
MAAGRFRRLLYPLVCALVALAACLTALPASYWNVSAYNQGMMGYKLPNIEQDRLRGTASARHGCLAGAFALGPLRAS